MPDIPLPDEAQPKFYSRLIGHLQDIAEGYDLNPSWHNRLDDGIWELKRDAVRLTFYDTDGNGSYTPKFGKEYEEWDGRVRYVLDPEEMEEDIRVGHAFSKNSQRTSPEDLAEAAAVREEDLNHD